MHAQSRRYSHARIATKRGAYSSGYSMPHVRPHVSNATMHLSVPAMMLADVSAASGGPELVSASGVSQP